MLAIVLTCLTAVVSSMPGGISVDCAPLPSPAPIVTAAPTPIPTIAPTPAPVSAAQAAQACANSIVNGSPLPPCASQVFFPGGPYRRVIPSTAAADPNSTTEIQAYVGSATGGSNDSIAGLMWHAGISQSTYAYSHPLYRASISDPTLTASCVEFCAQGSAVGIHVPAHAFAEGGLDRHLAVLQPDGTILDTWGWAGNPPYSTGQTVKANTVAVSVVDGTKYSSADLYPAFMRNAVTAGGMVSPSGIVTLSELQQGVIPHELFGTVSCVSPNWYPPATQTGRVCTDGRKALPMGGLLQYIPDAAAIAASSMSSESKIVALAAHLYGIRISDTGGGGGIGIKVESQMPFWAYGSGVDPYIYYAQSHGWNHIVVSSANPPVNRYTHVLTDLNLPHNLRLLSSGN